MYTQNLALNNIQWLIYHKTQPNQTPLGQSEPGSNGHKGVLPNLQLSSLSV